MADTVTRSRDAANRTLGGFTLVELLVVIVVIGILAAIAIPVFLSQADKASDTALKSDLTNAAKLLQVAEASGETIPSEITAGQVVDLGSAGTFTSTQTLTVTGSGETLCVEGTSASGDTYSADLSEGIRNYDCDGNANGIEPLVLSYADTSFTTGAGDEPLEASATGGSGPKTYTLTGDLPDAVSFDAATGTFTGPADVEWGTATDVIAGIGHACALTDEKKIDCWGYNGWGQLNIPTAVGPAGDVDVVAMDTNFNHVCAVRVDGAVQCWGYNTFGSSNVPSNLAPGGADTATDVAAGAYHSCAVLSSGAVQCWGAGISPDEEWPGLEQSIVPDNLAVGTQTDTAVAITAGQYHTCALLDTGAVDCWGRSTHSESSEPSNLAPGTATDTAVSLDAGRFYSCALLDTGAVQCWGSFNNPGAPADLQTGGALAVSAGYRDVCVLRDDGSVQCWGYNVDGETDVPSELATGTATQTAVAVAAGRYRSCALIDDGSVTCWGEGPHEFAIPPGLQVTPGPFPSTLTVTVEDDSGSTSTEVTLTAV